MTLMRRFGGTKLPRLQAPVEIHPFAVRFKRTRKVMGLTRPQLAEQLGVTQLTIAKVELGRMPLRKSTRAIIEMWAIRHDSTREEIKMENL